MIHCVSVLSVVGLLLSPASCQTVTGPVQDLSDRNADFAARLYRAVASRTDDNVLLSPLTLSAALTALSCASTGPTGEQLLQGLSLPGLDPQTIPGGSGVRGHVSGRCRNLNSNGFMIFRWNYELILCAAQI